MLGGSEAAAVLRVLADLSPSHQSRTSAMTVPLDWFRWLPARGVVLFPPVKPEEMLRQTTEGIEPEVQIDRGFGERLAAIDRVRAGQQLSLRAGWLWVAGRQPLAGGRTQRVLHPLVTVPVTVSVPSLAGAARIRPAGDATLTELIADRAARHRLEAAMEFGGGGLSSVHDPEVPEQLLHRLVRLRQFAFDAAIAAGFEVHGLVPAANHEALLRSDRLTLVAGVAVYTATDIGGFSAAESLRSWADQPIGQDTALHHLYFPAEAGAVAGEDGVGVVAPYPLNPPQLQAVARARDLPVSVISGAPGTGKSHVVSAIACDAVARGETVLVTAKSDAAVDALVALLHSAGAPEPVIFGSNQRREHLARRLAAGELQAVEGARVGQAEELLAHALAERRHLMATIAGLLAAEQHLAGDREEEDAARRLAPGLFDPATDLDAVHEGLDEAGATGWWSRHRARRALARATALAGPAREVSASELLAPCDVAHRARAAGDLQAAGGLELTEQWRLLEEAEGKVRHMAGVWLTMVCRSPARLNASTLPAVSVLGTALRSGRAARRAQLARLDDRLTRALPLWVGTLGDIEDLLPARPGLFDLVILDEASAIDQPLAAPGLLRAKRGVVVGDPHQLRHVSFLADDQLRRAATAEGLDGDPVLVGRLDVRRNSLFDVAVGCAPATVLDEHFRSAPHLVDFVAHRLYNGRLLVATRSPRTEAYDGIDVVRMAGERDRDGVVQAEVRAVLARLRDLERRSVHSVGVISPFRAQADALEEAILEQLSMASIESLDLRVGTVHAFQGNERDTVIVSMGIGERDGPATWRFVEDPHLFAVLATRARESVVLLLSADPPAGGLVAGYVAQSDAPPGRPAPAGEPDPWTASIASGLRAAGVDAVVEYPIGRHTVDVCAGAAYDFVGLECSVHPGGPAAHVERHLALRRAGWTLVDAYKSRWHGREAELLVDLAARLPPATV